MRFEPRLACGDEGDDDLPAESAELATQLRLDAGYLAQRFPSATCVAPRNHACAAPLVRWRASALVAASAACTLLFFAGWLLGRHWLPPSAAAKSPTVGEHAAGGSVRPRLTGPIKAPSVSTRPRGDLGQHSATAGGAARRLTGEAETEIAAVPASEVEAVGDRSSNLMDSTAVGPDQHAAEVAVAPPAANAGTRLPRDEATLLRVQLAAFEKVIARLETEIDRRDAALQERNALIRDLTAEVARLRAELEAAQADH